MVGCLLVHLIEFAQAWQYCAGEGPCLATFWVRRYWQLLVLRTLTGISVGGALPLVLSLVGDLFFVTQRAQVAALVQVATGAGFALSQLMAGIVGMSITEPQGTCPWQHSQQPLGGKGGPVGLLCCLEYIARGA